MAIAVPGHWRTSDPSEASSLVAEAGDAADDTGQVADHGRRLLGCGPERGLVGGFGDVVK